jgi:diphthamide biosynthesis methyltransferase
MLYLIGLGLGSEFDLSLRAFSALDKCDMFSLRVYTGVFNRLRNLRTLLGKSIMVLSREDVESKSDVHRARQEAERCLARPGDPLSANYSRVYACLID